MVGPENRPTPIGSQEQPYAGPERRSGLERRQDANPQPPAGLGERRRWVRRKADRLALEKGIRIGCSVGGRVYPRVHIEVPVLYRPLSTSSVVDLPAQRGMTHTLAPGGLGMLLREAFRAGTFLEVLVRFDRDLLAADVRVLSVLPHGELFLHNCRFTRLGEADRNWLTEYLQPPDALTA